MPRMQTKSVLRLAILTVLAATTATFADGGIVRHVQNAGPWRVTVFTSPTPFRAGPVDISFLIQDAATGDAILDAAIDLTAEGPTGTVHTTATRTNATNRMLYAALLTLPALGEWSFTAGMTRAGHAETISFSIPVAPALPPWQTYWPWFSVPMIGIWLFVAHQAIVWQRHAHENCSPY